MINEPPALPTPEDSLFPDYASFIEQKIDVQTALGRTEDPRRVSYYELQIQNIDRALENISLRATLIRQDKRMEMIEGMLSVVIKNQLLDGQIK